jgi:hypothetical protein
MDWALPTDQVLAKVSPDPNAAGSSIKKGESHQGPDRSQGAERPSRLMQPGARGRETGRCVASSLCQRSHANLCLLLATKIRLRHGRAMWRNIFGGRAPHFQGHRNLTDELIGLLTDCYNFVALHVVAMQTNDSRKERAKC